MDFSTDLYIEDDVPVPAYFEQMLTSKQIRNLTSQELGSIFTEAFDISPYPCYCIGYNRQTYTKDVKILMLQGCVKTPLIGQHLITTLCGGRGVEEIVPSLNSLRTKVWFADKLSFERSTFLLYEDKFIVRLSQIRHLIRLPLLSNDPNKPRELSGVNTFIFYPSIRFHKDALCVKQVVNHIKGLLFKFKDDPGLHRLLLQELREVFREDKELSS
jgi:hypothetical protein